MNPNLPFLHWLFIALLLTAFLFQGAPGSRTGMMPPYPHQRTVHISSTKKDLTSKQTGKERLNRNSGGSLIGSVAPTCTYNECRGCKYRCRAEQVPVEGNDPINSAYHYKCVCHR